MPDDLAEAVAAYQAATLTLTTATDQLDAARRELFQAEEAVERARREQALTGAVLLKLAGE